MKKVLLVILGIVIGGIAIAGYAGYRFVKFAMQSGCVNCFQVNGGGPMIQGSGNVTTQTRQVAEFKAIDLQSAADLTISQTGTPSVTLTVDDNLQTFFTSDVKDGVLHLGTVSGKSFQTRGKLPVFHVTVASLQGIEITGSGDVRAENLDGAALMIGIAGSGDMRITGRADELTVTLHGSGDIDASGLQAKRAKVVISGSGDATVNASDALDVRISGSGDLRYLGSPQLTKSVSGSGSVERK